MVQTNKLKVHFPMIREKEELLEEIRENKTLSAMYESWNQEAQENFLNFCCGNRGIKVMYDAFFKEVMNPEADRSRLEDFLCTVLNKNVKIVKILQNDNTRIADETSLLVTDIVVELEDGSLANVEVQKIGYMFSGPRCACYSADLLLRQYKRVREQKLKEFSYRDIKTVFLIVIYETSPLKFKKFPDIYLHRARQEFDTGLDMDLLQEYIMIPLDNFKKSMQNKTIKNKLEAWLTFLSEDRPERIVELITLYPEFKAMYQTLYNMCQNTEQIMGIFSEELRELDRNTVKYMVEEQQKEIEANRAKIEQDQVKLEENRVKLEENRVRMEQDQAKLEENRVKLEENRVKMEQDRVKLAEKDAIIAALQKALDERTKK
ncbi:MAG: PD-(D/E)XK nuclease family transposase [Lachnospiraceae bacterium]|nr:PD-(D/E)XK nuclease family transposase [Lachnospiraceae bacterium]